MKYTQKLMLALMILSVTITTNQGIKLNFRSENSFATSKRQQARDTLVQSLKDIKATLEQAHNFEDFLSRYEATEHKMQEVQLDLLSSGALNPESYNALTNSIFDIAFRLEAIKQYKENQSNMDVEDIHALEAFLHDQAATEQVKARLIQFIESLIAAVQ
jgi:hypothetical protein